jgi:hypothetical protein
MPGRYAKFESSPGFIASIDRYAYRAPVARSGAAEDAGVEESGMGADAVSDEPDPEPDTGSEGEPALEERTGEAVGAA